MSTQAQPSVQKSIERYNVTADVQHLEELITAAYALTSPPTGDGDFNISEEMITLFYLLGTAKTFVHEMSKRSEAAWESSSYATKENHPCNATSVRQ